MEAKDVLNLPWKKVKDWSNLSTTPISRLCGYHLDDINRFVDKLYQHISFELNIPYEELRPILLTENEAFYRFAKKIFKDPNDWCSRDSSELYYLQNFLIVPDADYIVSNTESKVTTCLKLFGKLSDMEKIQFLQKIGKISVTVQTENVVD